MRTLNNTVHVEDYDVPDGRGSWVKGTKESDIPAWAVKKIGDHAWDGTKEPTKQQASAKTAVELLAEAGGDYSKLNKAPLEELAKARGLQVPADAKKDELAAALQAAQ